MHFISSPRPLSLVPHPSSLIPHSSFLIPHSSFPHSHSLIPSFPHSLIPSFPHSLIPSFPHSFIYLIHLIHLIHLIPLIPLLPSPSFFSLLLQLDVIRYISESYELWSLISSTEILALSSTCRRIHSVVASFISNNYTFRY